MDKGAIEIASALKQNNTLTLLNLNNNNISNEGAKAIAKALKKNTTLYELDLRYNNIEDTGAIEIANALKINTTVKIDILKNVKISAKIKNKIYNEENRINI